MFIDYAVSKDCINIHYCNCECNDCLLHPHSNMAKTKYNYTNEWVICGFRNFALDDDANLVRRVVISKSFKERPTLEQKMDFIKKYCTYNVAIRQKRKECPF